MEARKVLENVQGINGGQTSTGTLRLTDYHLVFCVPPPEGPDTKPGARSRESWITYPMISYCCLRLMPSSSGIPSSIRLRCRDFAFVTFNFDDDKVAREVFDFIKSRSCKLGSVENLYAFKYVPLKVEKSINGWEIYDPKTEFRRQGISEKSADRGWRVTTINKDYTFCDTYPAMLVVPSTISDNVLKYARDFRSRNRIPALSYIHPINNCTITRSSQPQSGITRKYNVQDEKLVAASFSASVPGSSEDSTPVMSQTGETEMPEKGVEATLSETERFEDDFISKSAAMYDEKTGKRLIYGAQQSNLLVDARPPINAIVNQMQGYGSENMERYKFARKIFLSIDNIHVMSSSLNKVIDAIKDADISSLPPNRELLAQSNWLKHIYSVLDGAGLIARQVGINHSHVLIHCSDGWDRTSQLSALSQIMLDPYYRTLEGFIVLVEKDWLSFGHMFRLRSGHLSHENWFTINKDAMAGSVVQPGENDGRGDAFQNALASARRFFNQNKDEPETDPNGEATPGKIANDEATVPHMVSPIFHQFLDSVYQLVRQHPERFEYNERFLRRLLYHLYSCQYGTFLYNSEKQRRDARVQSRTSSVWGYFMSRKPEFTNPEYSAGVDDHVKGRERIILPKLKEIRWWHQAFRRTDEEMNSTLNAAAAAERERAAATASMQAMQPLGSPSQPTTPPLEPQEAQEPPSAVVPQNQSVLAAVETAHAMLTPETREEATLRQQTSPTQAGPFAALREGISNLGMGR